MRDDIYNWTPLTVAEAAGLFRGAAFQWGFAGGWALDLHLGRQTREHADTDILLFRDEQSAAYRHLSREWLLYKAERGKLSPWREGEYLKETGDIWASRDDRSPWAFQLMLADREGDSWVYRRERSIRRPAGEIFLQTQEGIPYLKPEIQLLYKGGGSRLREKDRLDLDQMLPALDDDRKRWLADSLAVQFPEGHDWIGLIRAQLPDNGP